MKLIDKTLFFPTPGEGTLVRCYSLYTGLTGLRKMRVDTALTADENLLFLQRSFSDDNGRTWTNLVAVPVKEPAPNGTRRWHLLPPFVDPTNGKMITAYIEGVLPVDDPIAALRHWELRYRVSLDGGLNNVVDEQTVEPGYTPEHPMEGVWLGKNTMMTSDFPCNPIVTRGGRILVPICGNVLGDDGELYNPFGALCYFDAAVLIGRWLPENHIEWKMSQRVRNDPLRSSRGCLEPAIAEMPDGRIVMFIRGSNEQILDQPGVRWISISNDEGDTWSPPEPWTDTAGELCHSPSSTSQIMRHSNGEYYWLGNLTRENPQGSYPRYPLVIGRVDPDSLQLIRDSVTVIESQQPGDESPVMLSSFVAHEDCETSDILVHLSPAFAHVPTNHWTGKAYLYRIAI